MSVTLFLGLGRMGAPMARLHAAGFPSRSWTAEDLINWVSALLDPHRQTGDAIPLTYDDGRELRDQVIDRATRMRIDRQGIGLANPALDIWQAASTDESLTRIATSALGCFSAATAVSAAFCVRVSRLILIGFPATGSML